MENGAKMAVYPMGQCQEPQTMTQQVALAHALQVIPVPIARLRRQIYICKSAKPLVRRLSAPSGAQNVKAIVLVMTIVMVHSGASSEVARNILYRGAYLVGPEI